MRQNTFERAKIMYEILRSRKEISIDDIILQFEIAPSTAYNIAHILEILCERSGECVRSKRSFRWVGGTETKAAEVTEEVQDQKVEEDQEIARILNSRPLTPEEDHQLAARRAYVMKNDRY